MYILAGIKVLSMTQTERLKIWLYLLAFYGDVRGGPRGHQVTGVHYVRLLVVGVEDDLKDGFIKNNKQTEKNWKWTWADFFLKSIFIGLEHIVLHISLISSWICTKGSNK